jgi:RNA polymerase sigma-70 factor, ECF subfamily
MKKPPAGVTKSVAKHLDVVRGDAPVPRRDSLEDLLDRMYERHVRDVHRWVARLAGPRDDVEDLVHEVFLVAMRRRGEFRGDGKVSTWLFRISALVVKERRGRDRARRWLFSRHHHTLINERPPTVTPLDELERRERIARLYAALDRLPDRYRTPLILYELEGMSGQDIAELLNMKLNLIWVRLHRGRARLLGELALTELPVSPSEKH